MRARSTHAIVTAVSIAENLKELVGKTKKYVVEDGAGIGRGNLSRYMTGERIPDDETVDKLAAYFKVPPERVDPRRAAGGVRWVEKPARYVAVEERLAFERASGTPETRLAVFQARIGLFHGEPTKADVDKAWDESGKTHADLVARRAAEQVDAAFTVQAKPPSRRPSSRRKG